MVFPISGPSASHTQAQRNFNQQELEVADLLQSLTENPALSTAAVEQRASGQIEPSNFRPISQSLASRLSAARAQGFAVPLIASRPAEQVSSSSSEAAARAQSPEMAAIVARPAEQVSSSSSEAAARAQSPELSEKVARVAEQKCFSRKKCSTSSLATFRAANPAIFQVYALFGKIPETYCSCPPPKELPKASSLVVQPRASSVAAQQRVSRLAEQERVFAREEAKNVAARVEQLSASNLAAQLRPSVVAPDCFSQAPVISPVPASSSSSYSARLEGVRVLAPHNNNRSCDFAKFRRHFKDASPEIVDEAVRWVQINHRADGVVLKKESSQATIAHMINVANIWLEQNGYDLRDFWNLITENEVPYPVVRGKMMPRALGVLLQLCQHLRMKKITSSLRSNKRPLDSL